MTFKHIDALAAPYKIATNTGVLKFSSMVDTIESIAYFHIDFGEVSGTAIPVHVFLEFLENHKIGVRHFRKHLSVDLEDSMTLSLDGVREGYVKLSYVWGEDLLENVVICIEDLWEMCIDLVRDRTRALPFTGEHHYKYYGTGEAGDKIVATFINKMKKV